jgi:predicted CXXCH cytochrome family protein
MNSTGTVIGKGRGIFYIMSFILVAILLLYNTPASAKTKLKGKIPALCYDCHLDLKKDLSDTYVHARVKQGKCMACHSSHASKIKGLMSDDIKLLCLHCHKGIKEQLKKNTVHSAMRQYDCMECHAPHSSNINHLLVKKEKELCLNCHENVNKQLDNPYICRPFKEGKCSSCHYAHASSQDELMKAAPKKLCSECHRAACKVNDISIDAITAEMDCTSCHTGHSSPDKGLLGPYGHKIFLEKKCEECHEPIVSGKKITIKTDNEGLCFKCHTEDESRYGYFEGDIHVKDSNFSCVICHDSHASVNKTLTKKESNICLKCHESTEKRTSAMERSVKNVNCEPVKKRKCFECHIPVHSNRKLYIPTEDVNLCKDCHASEHKVTHPQGPEIIDPRNSRMLTCVSCHSMHNAGADFMLTHDGKKALCIQCHKLR